MAIKLSETPRVVPTILNDVRIDNAVTVVIHSAKNARIIHALLSSTCFFLAFIVPSRETTVINARNAPSIKSLCVMFIWSTEG